MRDEITVRAMPARRICCRTAARDANHTAARAAARTAGHAAATVHVAGHAPQAAHYAVAPKPQMLLGKVRGNICTFRNIFVQ